MAEYRVKRNGAVVSPSTFKDGKGDYYGSNEVEEMSTPKETLYKEELFHKYFGQVVQGMLSGGDKNDFIEVDKVINKALVIAKEMMKHI